MAVSNVSICNQALYLLGESEITLLTDEDKPARTCNVLFEPTRDAVMRMFPWNFAIARAELSLDSTAPSFGYSGRYPLPTSPYCLRVLETHDKDIEYKVEGRYILTDSGVMKIKYISKVTDPTQFDVQFVNLLAAALAYKLAIPLTDSNTRKQEMKEHYIVALREARSTDSQEGTPDIENDDGSWLEARL